MAIMRALEVGARSMREGGRTMSVPKASRNDLGDHEGALFTLDRPQLTRYSLDLSALAERRRVLWERWRSLGAQDSRAAGGCFFV